MSPGGEDIFAGVFGAGADPGSGDGLVSSVSGGGGGGVTRGNGGASGGGGVSGLPFNYHSNPISAFDLESLFSDPEPPANPDSELMYSFDWPQYNPSHAQHGSSDRPSSAGVSTGRGAGNGGAGGGNGGMVDGPNWLDLLATAVPELEMGTSPSSSMPPTSMSMSGSGSGLSETNPGIEGERGDSEDGEGEFVGLDEGMVLDGFEMLGAHGRGEKKDSRSGGGSDG